MNKNKLHAMPSFYSFFIFVNHWGYRLKVLVSRKMKGQVDKLIDWGVDRWAGMRVAHFKLIGE
jgi:hypothetical protein